MTHQAFGGDLLQPGAADATGGAGEIFGGKLLIQTDNLKDLGTAVALQGADPHFGENLEQALADRLDVVLGVLIDDVGLFVGLVVAVLAGKHSLGDHVLQGLEGEVGVDCRCTVADQQGEVMDFARFSGFNDE